MSDLQDIREYNAFHLADRAECGEPSKLQRDGDVDSFDSAGATFLYGVRDAFLEAIEWSMGTSNTTPTADDVRTAVAAIEEDGAHEIADGAVPVYTYPRWQTFTDLAAWQEEPEAGEWPEDLTEIAGVALYQIADRLARSLATELEEWAEALESEEDDDDDEDDAPVEDSNARD